MSNTNQTSFTKAVVDFLSHASQTDGKQVKVLAAMLEMETSFDLEWAKKFHTATGKDKTAMIHFVLGGNDGLLPIFDELLETSKQKGKDVDKEEKEKAQNKVKALENLIRSAAFAVAFFRVKQITEWELTKANRIRYVLPGNKHFEDKNGETFKSLAAIGRETTTEEKWTAPVVSAGKVSSGAASEGSSVSETVEKMETTGNKYAGAFVQMANGTANLIEAKKLDELSESEQQALRRLEQVLIRKIFADSKGVVDVKLIAELYNTEPKPEKKAKKPMTAIEAENHQVSNGVAA
jgi:hypothetical protein